MKLKTISGLCFLLVLLKMLIYIIINKLDIGYTGIDIICKIDFYVSLFMYAFISYFFYVFYKNIK
jgi:hypothetical protein